MNLPKKVEERLVENLKKYQPIITSARDRDVNESDTVTIVSDLLSDLFGYNKYTEVTREYAIKGTFCDLAVKIENKVYMLIEVKAIGLELKDFHTRQAVDYAVNLGIDWVILTNGFTWKVYKVLFSKPVSSDLVMEFNIPELSHKNQQHREQLFLLTKEAINKSALQEFHALRQATNRFCLAAVVLSDAILNVIRREIRRMNPSIQIQPEELKEILVQEVIKREVLENDGFKEAVKKINRSLGRQLRATTEKEKKEETQQGITADAETEPIVDSISLKEEEPKSGEITE